jgi:hypothetical protein
MVVSRIFRTFDFVVMRYNWADSSGLDSLKAYPLISEYQTLGVPEHQSYLAAG